MSDDRKTAETVEARTEAFAREWNQRPGVRRVIEGADHLVATPEAVEALDQEVERILATPDAEIPDAWKAGAALTEALSISLVYTLQSLNGDELTRDQLLMVQLRSHLELVKIEHRAQLDAAVAAARAETREACAGYHVAKATELRQEAVNATPSDGEWFLLSAERHERDAAAIREGKDG